GAGHLTDQGVRLLRSNRDPRSAGAPYRAATVASLDMDGTRARAPSLRLLRVLWSLARRPGFWSPVSGARCSRAHDPTRSSYRWCSNFDRMAGRDWCVRARGFWTRDDRRDVARDMVGRQVTIRARKLARRAFHREPLTPRSGARARQSLGSVRGSF